MQGHGIYWSLGWLFKEIRLSVLFKCVNMLKSHEPHLYSYAFVMHF